MTGTALTPWGPVPPDAPESEMAERILDAAHDRFAHSGVAATTMSQLARDVGISRVWLYRHYPNRDAVMTALVARETRRFLDGVRERFVVAGDSGELVRDAFVYSVEFLRQHTVLQRVLVTEPENIAPFLVSEAGSVVRLAVDAVSGYLRKGACLPAAQARMVAETLTRLALSMALSREASFDVDDHAALRRFAAELVPRLLS